VLLGPHVGAEGDPKQKKGDLEQDRKGLHDSIKKPCQAKQPVSASFQGVALVTHTSGKMLTIFSM
jgi:hypothetical protein